MAVQVDAAVAVGVADVGGDVDDAAGAGSCTGVEAAVEAATVCAHAASAPANNSPATIDACAARAACRP
ncbi:hypothetical protein QZM66_00015 [Burkholderia contaminans]|nr:MULTISPECIES: hypothetical protein [Burkholderia]MDN7785921.1 hypothetical protein [Burkholderia contaminans]